MQKGRLGGVELELAATQRCKFQLITLAAAALALATAGRAVAVASARSITDAAAQPATATTLAAAAAALAVRLSGTEISVGDLKIRPLISSDFGWRFRPTPYYGWRPR